jgi:hypothetical protein
VTVDAILARLPEISALTESYRGAAYLLEIEQAELRLQLRKTEWQPPSTSSLEAA